MYQECTFVLYMSVFSLLLTHPLLYYQWLLTRRRSAPNIKISYKSTIPIQYVLRAARKKVSFCLVRADNSKIAAYYYTINH